MYELGPLVDDEASMHKHMHTVHVHTITMYRVFKPFIRQFVQQTVHKQYIIIRTMLLW